MSKKEFAKSIARLYYSNPQVQKALFDFSKHREVVPSYSMESFGKRPDALQYPSDLNGLVNKGATSFHASEELWDDVFKINSELSSQELSQIRKSWDLLIDIDSPYLDYSKLAAKLIIKTLERYGIKSYGIKFSGSKGFHLIVPAKAFPEEFKGLKTKDMFPEWPRAISQFLMHEIKPEYNKLVSSEKINFSALEERTKLSREDITLNACPNCGEKASKTNQVTFECDKCGNLQVKPDYKITKRKLRCISDTCSGYYQVKEEKELFKCSSCNYSSLNKIGFKTSHATTYTKEARQSKFSEDFKEEISGEQIASLDLVLVAPRHLFRMPYSLHEKTALASIVITKDEIESFSPKQADPLKVKVLNFYPDAQPGEASFLLENALNWKEKHEATIERSFPKKNYENIEISGVTEAHFPQPIKKLLKGLKEGRKRGLFILITFLRSLNFPDDYIENKVREWNKKNEVPLKEGYIKSQLEWHLRQKKKILPPNYGNESFYKDLQLIEPSKTPLTKNPVGDVVRKIRREQNN